MKPDGPKNTNPTNSEYTVDEQCCGSGIFIPDPGIIIFSIPDPNFLQPGSRIRIKEFKYLTQKTVSKLSESWSGLFIPDQIYGFN
jgi:hypothetical protein